MRNKIPTKDNSCKPILKRPVSDTCATSESVYKTSRS